MILSADSPDSEDLNDQNFLEIYQSAMDLYGLIHARFILTPRGLAMMKEKYMLSAFSYCPRVLCERHNVLPIGVSEELSTSRVKVYCPRCQDVYIPRQKQLDIDGAYFGTSFPHIFLKQFPELLPKGPAKFVPKIYGFKIFGMRGSKYELKFDYQGKPTNEDEMRQVLKKGAGDQSHPLTGLAQQANPTMVKQASTTMEKEKPKNVLKQKKGSAEDDPMNAD
jgi:casein kinase II subunit beta